MGPAGQSGHDPHESGAGSTKEAVRTDRRENPLTSNTTVTFSNKITLKLPSKGLHQRFAMAYHDPYSFGTFASALPTLSSALPAISAPIVSAPYESTEDKLAKLKKTLSGALEVIQERNGLQPRAVILKEPKTKVERIPVPQYYGYSANPQQSFINQTVHETKEVKKQVVQPVQKPDGTFENQSVTVTTVEPQFNVVGEFQIQRIPKGQDVTEYCAEEGSELSKALFDALKQAAESLPDSSVPDKSSIKNDFKKATTAFWGAYPKNLQVEISTQSLPEKVKAKIEAV
jgi:hypothetical protein